MSYENVIWEQDGGVGRLTLNRPDSLNAWTADFGRELKQVIESDAADPSVRAVLITGAGRGFSSGADLKEGFDPAEDGMPDVRKELDALYHPIIAGVRRLEKPVVAAVNGPAVGIGASLALRLRPRAGGRVGLLRARLREHRPHARRRLDAVRAERRRQGAGASDGAARRARGFGAAPSTGAS